MPISLTVRDALQTLAVRLAGQDDLRDRARLDAQQLLGIATGISRVQQLAAPDRLLTDREQQRLEDLLWRRLRAEPMQHLRGSQDFYGRDFLVSPDVLIPRPETEDIVTAVLEAVPDRSQPLHIADVGTGSGVLAITLALELAGSVVTGFDISPEALTMAQRNADRLGAANRVRLVESDLLAAAKEGESFDIIVSNPPYIPLPEASALHAEVRHYEPHLALFGGVDGLDVIRRLLPEARQHLRKGGLLLMETAGRNKALDSLLTPWHNVHYRQDLQGIARVVSARRDAASQSLGCHKVIQ